MSRARFGALAGLSLLGSACGGAPRSVNAIPEAEPPAAEAPIAVTVNVGPAKIVADETEASRRCIFTVVAKNFKANSNTCTVTSGVLPNDGGRLPVAPNVAPRVGILTAPCGTVEGEVTADFGTADDESGARAIFRGTGTADQLNLERTIITPFFGCDWRVREKISGSARDGALRYTYAEERVDTGCTNSLACTASAILELVE